MSVAPGAWQGQHKVKIGVLITESQVVNAPRSMPQGANHRHKACVHLSLEYGSKSPWKQVAADQWSQSNACLYTEPSRGVIYHTVSLLSHMTGTLCLVRFLMWQAVTSFVKVMFVLICSRMEVLKGVYNWPDCVWMRLCARIYILLACVCAVCVFMDVRVYSFVYVGTWVCT